MTLPSSLHGADSDLPPAQALARELQAETGTVGEAGRRGTALVVDDEPVNRLLLTRMLDKEGFRTLEAQGGEEALTLFEAERPDIVFMDVMMPRMDGFEATQRIKHLAGMDFVPVIFLTALRDEDTLIRCTEAGGDDYLSKPYNIAVLKSRIIAMERVRDLQRTIAANNRSLSELLERDREEQSLAERVFSRAVKNRNVALDRLGLIQRPAAIFSGDLVLTQYLPDTSLRVLIGDFTGHGLAAAIGALAVADAFHAMTRKGVDDLRVLSEINRKLYQMLPADRFMAGCLLTIPRHGQELRWWNGGMPSVWLRTTEGLEELVSHALPLGILPELPRQESPRCVRFSQGDRLLLMTDGLLEASDQVGRMFCDAGFPGILEGWHHGEAILPRLFAALDDHCTHSQPADDIAVVEIPLDQDLFLPTSAPALSAVPRSGWCWSLELEGDRLGSLPSVDAILRPLGLVDGLESHLSALETILTELYSNALEHGILKLYSPMKATPDGFDAYYQERAKRLAEGCAGRILVSIHSEPRGSGGSIRFQVADTGPGFTGFDDPELIREAACPWGHGIPLVRGLCESVTYRANGSQVEAVYRW